MIINTFKNELEVDQTNFFILDTKGTATLHGDIDFESYDWSPSKFNLVKEGDLFLYRRPASSSEINKQFYFFGAGKIESIEKIGSDRVKGKLSKCIAFMPVLLPTDLEEFSWTFKTRKQHWGNFFNQYGMNKITKDDFVGIIERAFNEKENVIEDDPMGIIEDLQKQQKRDYYVDDYVGTQKRRRGQFVFSEQVKKNYSYRCAITGINTKNFLIGSHIIPWSIRKDIRLDPKNGICLSVLMDRAFDKGYITITPEFRVMVSIKVSSDSNLSAQLKEYNGKKIKVPSRDLPNKDYLIWHYDNVFLK